MKLSVIIVSYNVRHYLEQCLHSVWDAAQHGGVETEVFVVDNASNDDSVAYLRKKFPAEKYPDFHLIANSRNVGFGSANNQAARLSRGEYILFLNPDTLLTEQTLADSIRFADEHPDLGGLGVKMLKTDGTFALESRRGLPTPWTSFCKMSGLAAAFPKSRRFGKYYMRYLDENKAERIEIISGAYLLCRKAALDRCGLFDEDFFMYGEDIDLSYRLLLSGFHNYYIPSPILHYKGESTQKSSYRYVHVFYEAMLIFFKKHFRHYRWGLAIPIKAAIYIRALLALLMQQLSALKAIITLGKKETEEKFCFIGTKEHADTVRRIADQWRLEFVYVERDAASVPTDFPDEAEGCLCVITDLSLFSRAEALALFSKHSGKYFIGTFSPETNTVITPSAVYTLRND